MRFASGQGAAEVEEGWKMMAMLLKMGWRLCGFVLYDCVALQCCVFFLGEPAAEGKKIRMAEVIGYHVRNVVDMHDVMIILLQSNNTVIARSEPLHSSYCNQLTYTACLMSSLSISCQYLHAQAGSTTEPVFPSTKKH